MQRPDGLPLPDFGALSDEQLVLLARDGDAAAGAALLDRCLPAMLLLIGWWAGGHNLRADEVEDAEQEAALAYLAAVARYAPAGADRPPTSFQTYLNQAVRYRLGKWCRRRRRAEGRLDRSADWAAVLERRALRSRLEAAGAALHPRTDDPAALALWQEARDRLAAALAALDDTDRSLWDGRAQGRPLTQIAAELGLSYHRARRLLRKMLSRLREAVA